MTSIYVDTAVVADQIITDSRCYRRTGPSRKPSAVAPGDVTVPEDPCCCNSCPDPLPSGLSAQSYQQFSGGDSSVAPGGAHPNSDAAMAAFLAAAGGSPGIITFECQKILGAWTGAKILAPGITATLVAISLAGGLSNDNTSANQGFNTTPGGTVFLRYASVINTTAEVRFDFDRPIYAFGCYLTGLETTAPVATHILFDDGTPRDILLPRNPIAGVGFFGFVCLGITYVRFYQNNVGAPSKDVFGIDDVIYG